MAIAISFGGKLIDLISSTMTKRAQGHREPKYRLPALIIPVVIWPMGILLFGLTIAEKNPWIQPAIGYTIQGFGLTAVSNGAVTYAVDSYLPVSSFFLFIPGSLHSIASWRSACNCFCCSGHHWLYACPLCFQLDYGYRDKKCVRPNGCYPVFHVSFCCTILAFWKED